MIKLQRVLASASYFTISFSFFGLFLGPSVLTAQITGTVFRDFNADGKPTLTVPVTAAVASTTTAPAATTVAEPGVPNVVVTAFKADGTSVNVTTSAMGTYGFTAAQIPSGTKVRLEFSGWLKGNFTGPIGTGSATNVQYKTGGAGVTANLGISWPVEYCQSTPNLLTTCFTDNTSGLATDPSLIRFSTDQVKIKTSAATISSNGFNKSGLMMESGLGFQNTLGSVMGMAYHRSKKQIFSAAFVKVHDSRGAGAYPSGIGAIFKTDVSTATATTTLFTTIASVGTLTGASSSAAQSDVGRKGLGDLELNATEDTLFTVNIAAKTLIKIPLSSTLVAGTPIVVNLPTITGNGSAGVYPFGLAFNRGVLYVTFTADGTGGSSPLLKTFVYRYEGGSTFTQVLSLDMKYGRAADNSNKGGSYADNDHNFTDWDTYGDPVAVITGLPSSPTTSSNERARAQYTRSQPWLTDLAFDKGDMILGVRSRLGDVYNGLFFVKGGDILRACANDKENPTSWTIENDGTCGSVTSITPPNPNVNSQANNTGTLNYGVGTSYPAAVTLNFTITSNSQSFTYPTKKKEYYWDDDGWEGESTNGGVLQIPGYPQVFVTQDDWLGHGGQHGVVALDNTTGEGDFAGNVFYGFDDNNAWDISSNDIAKSGGLGDLIPECKPQPIEIGHSVWNDTNKNGIHDANESGIDGVIVELYDGTTKVGTATTANGGIYVFNESNATLNGATEVKPNTAYTLRIASTQFNNAGVASTPLSNLTLTTANATSTGLNDLADNDATIVSSLATIAYTTGDYGENDHTLDFGFATPPCALNLTTNVSGCFDSNGNAAGGNSVATVQVIVNWENNPSGETINVSCTGAAAQNINPVTATSPTILTFTVPANAATVAINAIFSTTTTCTATQNVIAPTGSCIQTPCVAGNTGGTVWRDFDNDGAKDATETSGVSGVTVTAYDCNGNVAATTTTDVLGQYTFTTLTPSATNKYRIEFSNTPLSINRLLMVQMDGQTFSLSRRRLAMRTLG